jgi:hypothetical protein
VGAPPSRAARDLQCGSDGRRTRSDNRELAALSRVASQRLPEQAEDAEVWIRPFVDHDEPAFAAAGTDRSVVFGRQLGRYRMQVYKNTHGRVLLTTPPRREKVVRNHVSGVARGGPTGLINET